MRVTAVTASAQLGGTERVLLDFALHAFEHDVILQVLTPVPGPLVEYLNDLGVPAQVAPAPRALLRASQQPGHLVSLLPAAWGLVRWARALRGHPVVRGADVVYTVAFKAHAALALARTHPVVWHLHEFPPARTGPLWRLLAHRVPDALIANSRTVADAWGAGVRGRGSVIGSGETARPVDPAGDGPADQPTRRSADPPISVVPNGVDLDRFVPRPRTFWIHDRLGLPHSARLVGMPAVFARWKGQLEVIRAFRLLAGVGDAHLVLVGGSIYDTVAERRFARELQEELAIGNPRNLQDRSADPPIRRSADATADPPGSIHLLPFQEHIERVYPEFDLAVHYSTRPEPFGRVILEALACGVPVVAPAEGGPVEILGGAPGARQEAGWLTAPRDPRALARTLREALSLPAGDLRALGAAGRRRAEDRHSARVFAAEVARILRISVR